MSGPEDQFDDDDWWKDEPDEQEPVGGEDVEPLDLEPAIPDGDPWTSEDAWAAIENVPEPEGTPLFSTLLLLRTTQTKPPSTTASGS